jgi:hypothetical protein
VSTFLIPFVHLCRTAGLSVSVAEALDAHRAAVVLGVENRAGLKAALGACLSKSPREAELFENLFEAFVGMYEALLPQAEEGDQWNPLAIPEDITPLSASLLQGDRAAVLALVMDAFQELAVAPPPAFTQRGAVVFQALQRMGAPAVAGDVNSLMALGAGGARAAQMLERRAASLVREVKTFAETFTRLYARARWNQPDPSDLADQPLTALPEADIPRYLAAVRRIVRRLRTRFGRRMKKTRRGRLDLKATLRRSAAFDGVPVEPVFRRKKIRKPQLVVVCDVSRSVQNVAAFFLLVLHSLHEYVKRLRTFAFCSNLVEITSLFDGSDPEAIFRRLLRGEGIPLQIGLTDYGAAFRELDARYAGVVQHSTTLVILGDARNTRGDPALDAFRRLSQRASRVIWLNPEPRTLWGTGDSEMESYAPFCSLSRVCNSLKHLEELVEELVGEG